MPSRLKKVFLLLLSSALLVGTGQIQKSLNTDRARLGLTLMEPLENAPPVLAFTTVALGGFRGLIVNMLWMRASELQDEDKFFEMAQLADWITKLEPHFAQVWVHQAWNMAYNISVKFKDFPDRWNWVQRGIELLRDEGLRYNPDEILIYRELSWFFQHKMGQSLDDAHFYYKKAWFDQMSGVFETARPNFDELIDPKTDDAKARAKLVREKFKLDPQFLKEVDERYGPLEWRLPEAHAIYWAAVGLEQTKKNQKKIKAEDIIMLHRSIYQSLHQSVMHGRVISNSKSMLLDIAPNLDIIRKSSDAYEAAINEDENNRVNISRAHRNIIREAVYFLYTYNRQAEAAKWFDYLKKHYPNDPLISGLPNNVTSSMSLDEYCLARVEEQIQDSTSRDNIRLILEGMISTSFYSLAMGEDDRAEGFNRFAGTVYLRYKDKTASSKGRVVLPQLNEIRQEVLRRLLDPERGFPPDVAAQLRTRLNLPAMTNTAPAAVVGH